MQNISYLEITSKLPKLGNKKLYFGVDISAYDGVRLLILQKLFLINELRKLYLKDKDFTLLIKISEHLIAINVLINSFDFIFDKLVVAKFNKLLGDILPAVSRVYHTLSKKNIELHDDLIQIDSYFDNGFESLCFELEIFLYDTHSFYCVLNSSMHSCAAYVIRKKIVNLRENIKDKNVLKSNLLYELLVLVDIFEELFHMGKFRLKLAKISAFKDKYRYADKKSIKKELNKKLSKFDKKLSKISKKLKPHYKKED